MARLYTVLLLGCAVALPTALGGCAGALVVGGLAAAAGGGYTAAQERGVNGAIDDLAIKGDIEKGMVAADKRLQAGVTATVYDHRVLLTGRVDTPDMRAAAEQAAGRTHDVRALYDEIEVAGNGNTWDDAKDAWITARVRSELVFDRDVRSVNYTIDTANGSVYLIGSARSQAELDRAAQIARYVPGVKRVVSYVEIRSGAPVAALPSPAPASMPTTAPMAAPPSYAPGAAPRAPIEVQKL